MVGIPFPHAAVVDGDIVASEHLQRKACHRRTDTAAAIGDDRARFRHTATREALAQLRERQKATNGRIRIAAPETFAIGVIPRLLPALREAAPRVRLESLHLEDSYQERLVEGAIDFAIYFDQEYPAGFHKHRLFSTKPVIWCRRDHPITTIGEVSLEDICRYPKLVSHLPSIKLTELLAILKTLEQIEVGREVLFETSHLMVALDMLQQSDALMISSDYLFQRRSLGDAVVSLPLSHIPLFDQLRFDLCLVQHDRTVNSRLHAWVLNETLRAFGSTCDAAQTDISRRVLTAIA